MKKLTALFLSLILLSSCAKNIEVDLTEEQRVQYQEQVSFWDAKIKNFEPEEGVEDTRTPVDFFIEKARYQEFLGNLRGAENTLQELLKQYNLSSVAWNNLAKIYEKQKNYKKALTMYQNIYENFPKLKQYRKDILRMYIALKEKDIALETYREYKKEDGFSNEDLLNKIQEL